MPGCTYLEDDAVAEEQISVEVVQECTDETAENYNQSAEEDGDVVEGHDW